MIIREENIEYISRDIGERYSGYQLVEKLKIIGVPGWLIEYPNTKWRMIYSVMEHYSNVPFGGDEAIKILSKIIEFSVHPINYRNSWTDAQNSILEDFNNRLRFDRLTIVESLDGYTLTSITENRPILKDAIPEKIFTTNTGTYITKKDEDFYYKGRLIDIGKKNNYYKVFCALYSKIPDGGEIDYDELSNELKNRIPLLKKMNKDEIRKFIQRNLTDKNNGFLRWSKIPETLDNGKKLIKTERGFGIIFNNTMD